MNTITPKTTKPSAWIGCIACYNEGHLVGEWFAAAQAASITPQQLHGHDTEHEELWCFDHEGIPVRGEISPDTASMWGSFFENLDDEDTDIAYAGIDAEVIDEDENGLPIMKNLLDIHEGLWENFTEFAKEHIGEIPEHLEGYIDFESYARDLENYGVYAFAPSKFASGIHIFSLL